MANTLEYKGYVAKVEYSAEDHVLFGRVEGICDLVTFESGSIDDIESEFQKSVDEYLAFCEEKGKQPDKAYSGTFNVRISRQLHREVAARAIRDGDSLNRAVENAITRYVSPAADQALPQT
ncbi:MAG: type II toxin-antitoxin system HicB family antitoxin [Clostridia bacterium]|nr:type II toxin-antitoxin system HicB family antitoxin [Clostridia bacterium]